MLKHFLEYATPKHRDDPGSGCTLAANGSEIARADLETRHIATEGFRLICEKAAPFMHSQDHEGRMETAISVMTNMIGALTMSRMVDDPDLSKQILEVTRRRIARSIGVPPSKSREQSAPRALKPHQKRARSKIQ
jgi:TetR/AcrR family transcriptional repressor of nem operon